MERDTFRHWYECRIVWDSGAQLYGQLLPTKTPGGHCACVTLSSGQPAGGTGPGEAGASHSPASSQHSVQCCPSTLTTPLVQLGPPEEAPGHPGVVLVQSSHPREATASYVSHLLSESALRALAQCHLVQGEWHPSELGSGPVGIKIKSTLPVYLSMGHKRTKGHD